MANPSTGGSVDFTPLFIISLFATLAICWPGTGRPESVEHSDLDEEEHEPIRPGLSYHSLSSIDARVIDLLAAPGWSPGRYGRQNLSLSDSRALIFFFIFFYLVMFGISRPDSYICHVWSYPDCRKNKDSTTRPSLLFSGPLFLCKTVGNDTWYGDYFIPESCVFFLPSFWFRLSTDNVWKKKWREWETFLTRQTGFGFKKHATQSGAHH